MPTMRCEENGKPGFKYGDSGKCYTYENGDKRAQEIARGKANKQGRAIEHNRRED